MPPLAERAGGAVDVELGAGVVDVEVAHRQLADAVERAEGGVVDRSIDSRSGAYVRFGPVVSRIE